MQVKQTRADGLMRQIEVVVPVQELNDRCNKRLDDVGGTVQIRGFRKGKVPKVHLKKVYGRRLMVEILQEIVEESSKKIIAERKEKPAAQPEIKLSEDQSEIDGVVSGVKDLSYSMKYEIIPTIDLADFSMFRVERPVIELDVNDVGEKLEQIAQRNTNYHSDHEFIAKEGSKLKISFSGTVEGKKFDGGSAEDVDLIIGQGSFLLDFEKGLKGAKAGQNRTLRVVFPDNYPVEAFRLKEATFEVAIKEVSEPSVPDIDDELAKSLGLKDLVELKNAIEVQLQNENKHLARVRLKQQLLDLLEKNHSFQLPSSLCDLEFLKIWKEVTDNLDKDKKTFSDLGKSEDEVRGEYFKLAERRVQLGLLFGKIGESYNIQVNQEELREAIVRHARAYPGKEQQVYDYFEKQPGAINQLRAPIFEEKVVDFLLSKIRVDDHAMSKEELLNKIEEENSKDLVDVSDQVLHP
ncbi:MAG: Trigger factor [Hyphomicrobiaceae bacterium hypho_1]